ncbi:ABC transporter permease [Spongiactinospora rosea]|uniref:Transport permease protein n=1 Tax=Spongiactinospora rosea TaxID=2248750 RepID=A0A366M1M8_9ACTN|nr:ABC transporter permease [Spongiactinospora rosea]RBQ20076.1 ABC transporter permease [Spongiactinospora rosea]
MAALTSREPPASIGGTIRWALTDGVTVVHRHLLRLRRSPGELAGELIFPAALVLLFGYVMGSAITVPGGDYLTFLMPGLFTMMTVTSVAATSVAVAGDMARGVTDRFRSMPMARLAVPFGQTGADILIGALAISIMIVCGLALGWRPQQGPLQTLAAFALLILLRYTLSWCGVLVGQLVKEQTADKLTPLVFPVTMISNAFVPTEHMVPWLRTIADWNPVSAAVTAARSLLGDPDTKVPADAAWPLTHPIAATLLSSAVILAVFVPLSVRRFRTADR